MARPVRIEFPGAVYHVITRGNNRQVIFRDDHDRVKYLEKLRSYCEQKGVDLLCYCLLSNHVHLLLETPQGNLSKMMQPFQTSYTLYFNRRHRRTGHLFEQRYKALLVDKDNYLLQVSRYIHLNPVGAGIVQRPQDYLWSSYGAYAGTKKMGGINRQLILEQFGNPGKRRLASYREFVEGALSDGQKWSELPVIKQVFVGEEDFVEQALREGARQPPLEGCYRLGDIVQAVCQVTLVGRDELSKALKEERVQRARELLMYVARRYSRASLAEIARYLGARDISTVSHGVRRAERYLGEDRDFQHQAKQVLKELNRSRIQA